jgi:hypothetical protein
MFSDDWLTQEEIEETDGQMARRHAQFRLAGERVAAAFAALAPVQRVVLFGSVAQPLYRELPRLAAFRRARAEIWHECKDRDLAVWLSDLGCLRDLQKARASALNQLFREQNVGVAHHQVDTFIVEPITDRYLGNLCSFATCPKGKPECAYPDCGAVPLLRVDEGFEFQPDALLPDRSVVLFDRSVTAEDGNAGDG